MRKSHPHPNPPPQGGGNNRKALRCFHPARQGGLPGLYFTFVSGLMFGVWAKRKLLYPADIVIYYTNEAALRLGRLLPPGYCPFFSAAAYVRIITV